MQRSWGFLQRLLFQLPISSSPSSLPVPLFNYFLFFSASFFPLTPPSLLAVWRCHHSVCVCWTHPEPAGDLLHTSVHIPTRWESEDQALYCALDLFVCVYMYGCALINESPYSGVCTSCLCSLPDTSLPVASGHNHLAQPRPLTSMSWPLQMPQLSLLLLTWLLQIISSSTLDSTKNSLWVWIIFFLVKIYWFENQRSELQRQIEKEIFHQWFTPKCQQWPRLSWAKARSFIWVSGMGIVAQTLGAASTPFPWCISRELGLKWKSWDSNHCTHGQF